MSYTYDQLLYEARKFVAECDQLGPEPKRKILFILTTAGVSGSPQDVLDALETIEIPLSWYVSLIAKEVAQAEYRKSAFYAYQYNVLKPGGLFTEGGVNNQILAMLTYRNLVYRHLSIQALHAFLDKVYWAVVARKKRLSGIRDYGNQHSNAGDYHAH